MATENAALAPTAAPPPRSRRRWWLALAALAVLAGWWGLGRLRGPLVRAVHPARRAVVETVVLSGRVLAPARVNLGVQVGGTARTVAVREGDRVTAGQLLLALDDAELSAAVAQAQAGVQQAGAGVARAGTIGEEVARQELAQATLALARADAELERQKRLFGAGAGTRKDLDDAERARAQAESQARAAQARLADTSPQGPERRRVGALRLEAEAALRLARTRLQMSRIVAPADGIILERHVEPGDLVTAGKALFVFAPVGETRLVAQLDEKELARVVVGQSALAAAEAAPDKPFDAEVSWIAPAVDPQRATVEVRLRVPQPPPFLRPDMTVSIDIRIGKKPDALVLAWEAVRDASGDKPWALVARDGRAVRVPLTVGLRGTDFVEVTRGLGPVDAVIPESERDAKEGGRVRVRVDAPASAGAAR